jgi:hypothetical protein
MIVQPRLQPEDKELYVLAESADRIAKERAMRRTPTRVATLPGGLYTSGSNGHSATARLTRASVEYLRRYAGLGQETGSAKQY